MTLIVNICTLVLIIAGLVFNLYTGREYRRITAVQQQTIINLMTVVNLLDKRVRTLEQHNGQTETTTIQPYRQGL